LDTWHIVKQLPPGRVPLLYKWVLKNKYDIYNNLIHKARLTVKGCQQRPGVDFTDTFSPVAKVTAIRLVLSYSVSRGFIFKQFDVQNAFPNAPLSDVDVYMVPPTQLNLPQGYYLKLQKALYGLKQAGREWNKLVTQKLLETNFRQLRSESCIFIYVSTAMYIILALYVDDMIIACDSQASSDWLFQQLSQHFVVKQNNLTRCLGLDVYHDPVRRTITISRHDYAVDLINEFEHYIAEFPSTTTCLPEILYSR
jgi:hypothetical protein